MGCDKHHRIGVLEPNVIELYWGNPGLEKRKESWNRESQSWEPGGERKRRGGRCEIRATGDVAGSPWKLHDVLRRYPWTQTLASIYMLPDIGKAVFLTLCDICSRQGRIVRWAWLKSRPAVKIDGLLSFWIALLPCDWQRFAVISSWRPPPVTVGTFRTSASISQKPQQLR